MKDDVVHGPFNAGQARRRWKRLMAYSVPVSEFGLSLAEAVAGIFCHPPHFMRR